MERRSRLPVASMLVVLAALIPAASHACGACAEDKVAATYDHDVVTRAAAAGDVMVFCEVIGPFDRQRLARAARRVRGIRADSIRTSMQPAALSFAIDPSKRSPQAAFEAMQRGMPSGARLTIVRWTSGTRSATQAARFQ